MIGLIGIVFALVLFLVLVYKGWSSYWVSALCAVVIGVFNLMKPADVASAYVSGLVEMIESIFLWCSLALS
ncbi:MAG: hypothetical protein LIO96_08635 [Lachnospiraceae bacterium]|nr:hypothetical protein [Lachnospiraceae bacterium]